MQEEAPVEEMPKAIQNSQGEDQEFTVKAIIAENPKKGIYKLDWEGTDEKGRPWPPTWEPAEYVSATLIREWQEKQRQMSENERKREEKEGLESSTIIHQRTAIKHSSSGSSGNEAGVRTGAEEVDDGMDEDEEEQDDQMVGTSAARPAPPANKATRKNQQKPSNAKGAAAVSKRRTRASLGVGINDSESEYNPTSQSQSQSQEGTALISTGTTSTEPDTSKSLENIIADQEEHARGRRGTTSDAKGKSREAVRSVSSLRSKRGSSAKRQGSNTSRASSSRNGTPSDREGSIPGKNGRRPAPVLVVETSPQEGGSGKVPRKGKKVSIRNTPNYEETQEERSGTDELEGREDEVEDRESESTVDEGKDREVEEGNSISEDDRSFRSAQSAARDAKRRSVGDPTRGRKSQNKKRKRSSRPETPPVDLYAGGIETDNDPTSSDAGSNNGEDNSEEERTSHPNFRYLKGHSGARRKGQGGKVLSTKPFTNAQVEVNGRSAIAQDSLVATKARSRKSAPASLPEPASSSKSGSGTQSKSPKSRKQATARYSLPQPSKRPTRSLSKTKSPSPSPSRSPSPPVVAAFVDPKPLRRAGFLPESLAKKVQVTAVSSVVTAPSTLSKMSIKEQRAKGLRPTPDGDLNGKKRKLGADEVESGVGPERRYRSEEGEIGEEGRKKKPRTISAGGVNARASDPGLNSAAERAKSLPSFHKKSASAARVRISPSVAKHQNDTVEGEAGAEAEEEDFAMPAPLRQARAATEDGPSSLESDYATAPLQADGGPEDYQADEGDFADFDDAPQDSATQDPRNITASTLYIPDSQPMPAAPISSSSAAEAHPQRSEAQQLQGKQIAAVPVPPPEVFKPFLAQKASRVADEEDSIAQFSSQPASRRKSSTPPVPGRKESLVAKMQGRPSASSSTAAGAAPAASTNSAAQLAAASARLVAATNRSGGSNNAFANAMNAPATAAALASVQPISALAVPSIPQRSGKRPSLTINSDQHGQDPMSSLLTRGAAALSATAASTESTDPPGISMETYSQTFPEPDTSFLLPLPDDSAPKALPATYNHGSALPLVSEPMPTPPPAVPIIRPVTDEFSWDSNLQMFEPVAPVPVPSHSASDDFNLSQLRSVRPVVAQNVPAISTSVTQPPQIGQSSATVASLGGQTAIIDQMQPAPAPASASPSAATVPMERRQSSKSEQSGAAKGPLEIVKKETVARQMIKKSTLLDKDTKDELILYIETGVYYVIQSRRFCSKDYWEFELEAVPGSGDLWFIVLHIAGVPDAPSWQLERRAPKKAPLAVLSVHESAAEGGASIESQYKSLLEDLQTRFSQLEQDNDAKQRTTISLRSELEYQQDQISRSQARMATLESQNGTLISENRKLKKQVEVGLKQNELIWKAREDSLAAELAKTKSQLDLQMQVEKASELFEVRARAARALDLEAQNRQLQNLLARQLDNPEAGSHVALNINTMPTEEDEDSTDDDFNAGSSDDDGDDSDDSDASPLPAPLGTSGLPLSDPHAMIVDQMPSEVNALVSEALEDAARAEEEALREVIAIAENPSSAIDGINPALLLPQGISAFQGGSADIVDQHLTNEQGDTSLADISGETTEVTTSVTDSAAAKSQSQSHHASQSQEARVAAFTKSVPPRSGETTPRDDGAESFAVQAGETTFPAETFAAADRLPETEEILELDSVCVESQYAYVCLLPNPMELSRECHHEAESPKAMQMHIRSEHSPWAQRRAAQ